MGQSRYRTREKIMHELLTNMAEKNGEIGATELMYKVFLSHYQLKEYLDRLEKRGMITRDPEQRSRLFITEKGKDMIGLLGQINSMIVHEPYKAHQKNNFIL